MNIPHLPIIPPWSGPQTYRLRVTKEMAQDWLRLNEKNRKPAASRIAQLIAMMNAGEWDEDAPCTISFTDKILIDGQHRLMALCGASGVDSLMMWAVANLPEKVQRVIDCGWTRTLSQRMDQDKNTTAMIQWIYSAKTGARTTVTPEGFTQILNEYRDGLEWCMDWTSHRGFCRTQVKVAVMLLWHEDKEKGELFREILLNDRISAMNHPADTLRRRIDRWLKDRSMPSQTDLYKYCLSATNAALQGRDLSKIYRYGG
jgi:hypothetical protein